MLWENIQACFTQQKKTLAGGKWEASVFSRQRENLLYYCRLAVVFVLGIKPEKKANFVIMSL